MTLQSLVAQSLGTPSAVKAKPVKATKPTKVAKPTKEVKAKPAKVAKVKPTKPAKVALVPYTVFFSAKRNKWMAVNGLGRTEAARKTLVAAVAFLKTKYNVTAEVL